MAIAFLGLGGNLGDAKQTLKDAIVCLAQHPQIEITARSCFYQSSPVEASGNDYINNVLLIKTELAPLPLLRLCQSVEDQFGRERPFENAPRTLDIDLLVYDQIEQKHPELTLPHPRMTERLFVLLPLLEIEPDFSLPAFGKLQAFTAELSWQKISRMQCCKCLPIPRV